MGKAKSLNDVEKGKIDAYHDQRHSSRFIAEKLGRSHTVVLNYLRNPENYGKNMKGCSVSKLKPVDKRKIIRIASNSALSARRIKEKAGVNVCVQTVRRAIQKAKHLKRMKIKKKPPLNEVRKNNRLQFGKEHMTWNNQWYKVVFSDEKKFNLDGPDGYNYYFHDLRKEELVLNRHHSREGGVMVWGGISYYGAIELAFQNQKMTAKSYLSILDSAFPKFQQLFGPLKWTYQQDNAPIHTARIVKDWISKKNVDLLKWPPYSPDLNIMENVWGWLSRKVYEGDKQYNDKESLIEAIKAAWADISLNYLKSLYDSMPNRIFELISKNGGSTHY